MFGLVKQQARDVMDTAELDTPSVPTRNSVPPSGSSYMSRAF